MNSPRIESLEDAVESAAHLLGWRRVSRSGKSGTLEEYWVDVSKGSEILMGSVSETDPLSFLMSFLLHQKTAFGRTPFSLDVTHRS